MSTVIVEKTFPPCDTTTLRKHINKAIADAEYSDGCEYSGNLTQDLHISINEDLVYANPDDVMHGVETLGIDKGSAVVVRYDDTQNLAAGRRRAKLQRTLWQAQERMRTIVGTITARMQETSGTTGCKTCNSRINTIAMHQHHRRMGYGVNTIACPVCGDIHGILRAPETRAIKAAESKVEQVNQAIEAENNTLSTPVSPLTYTPQQRAALPWIMIAACRS